MNDKLNNNNHANKYVWNDSLILDKIQHILADENIDELEFTEEVLEHIKAQLNESISSEEISQLAYIVAQSIDELKVLPEDNIRDYILRLINYLNDTTFMCIRGEFKGIEFNVYQDSSVEDVFNEYYSKYDEIYGISEMLSDLGLK
ncbi:hypothetical protein EAI30_07305 [Romboutsia ilealis]|uniref:Uncharacterized protein n=1 Tax=Romboutsia faecis TaxID=2764597 RepID=A0ABR7JK83_9FIRM|nr:hypothetical protein [Romboutsia faecis]MBC5995334.1 hypothetical protein [Romboutsia faecis]MRN24420.1 hypothetical protein [Romboutsia ilealis]